MIEYVVGAKPPNAEKISEVFHPNWERVIVTYGNKIYSSKPVSDELKAHESVHVEQQGDNPEAWWGRYYTDNEFRVEQEVEAYRAQMKFVKKQTKDRNVIHKKASELANDLSGTMYGSCIDFQTAYRKIR